MFKGHKLQASTLNIFGRLNSQFKLPKYFISQNDRGSLSLSIEYHLHSGIHVPGRQFCRWNLPKSNFLIMLFRRVNLKFFKKFRFESFPILITALCKGRVIELCDIKIILIFVLVFLHESKIRSTFFNNSRRNYIWGEKKCPTTETWTRHAHLTCCHTTSPTSANTYSELTFN